MKALNRLTTRRFPATDVYTIDQARELSLLSRALGRQLGMLIDRKGRVDMVLVGEAGGILIPELPRARSGADRLRGLRLLHTHLTPDGLSQEDLMDLLFLRLDAIIVLTVNPDGDPVQWQEAHLLPTPVAGQPYRVEQLRPWDQTSAHFAATAEALEEELARRSDDTREASDAPRALLVSVAAQPRIIQERNLDELAELARTAGLAVAGRMVQRVAQVNPKFILGKGKMAELEVLALEGRAGILVFDGELSPAQLHNLADITERKVLDRTQLILDIFAQHAVTRAGKLQVELAQLRYTQPRLTGKNRAMDRLMGGIGGRGPGETKLETDRRRSRERMTRLRKELDQLRRQRAFTRSRRARRGIPLAALVGYTNAGKSTLLNAITGAGIPANDRLFDTLDTTTRLLTVSDTLDVVISDTVGFIRKLPHQLVEAFKATLEELEYADLLLHVIDVSNPEWREQARIVDELIRELGAEGIPCIRVYNKCDAAFTAQQEREQDAVYISARTGEGIPALLEAVDKRLDKGTKRVVIHLPYDKAGLLDGLYREAKVEGVEYGETVDVTAVCTPRIMGRLKAYIEGWVEPKEDWE